jgi:hypothetical protein
MRQILKIRFSYSTGIDCDPMHEGVCRPVRSGSGIGRRCTVKVKANGARVPTERIVVMIQGVPAGVQRSMITAERRGRRSASRECDVSDILICKQVARRPCHESRNDMRACLRMRSDNVIGNCR